MQVELDKWVVFGQESDPNGCDFEYLLTGPSAHFEHDEGCLKVRRRVSGVLRDSDRMFTTHGRRFKVPEWLFEGENRADLHTLLDQYTDYFMHGWEDFPLNWGEYTA